MLCPKCDSEITESINNYSYCCGVHLYYSKNLELWCRIPSLDGNTNHLKDWNGTGSNFLIELKNSITPNFLLTRLKHVWDITGVNSIHYADKKNDRSMEKLSEYGLMMFILPYDKSKKQSKEDL